MPDQPSPAQRFHELFPRPGGRPRGFPGHLFWLLSSFWLAITLLAVILVTVAVATIYEAKADADYAHYMVYRRTWFEALLVLLGVNVIAAALSRWPWQRRHTGFLITHLGLITVITGSAISRYAGWEGQLALEEGEQGRTVRLKKILFGIETPDESASRAFPVEFRYDPPGPDRPQRFACGSYEVMADQYYSAAQVQDVVEPGGIEFFPAVKVHFQSPMASAEPWLLLRDPRKDRINFGPAQFAFVEAQNEEELQAMIAPEAGKPTPRGHLHLALANGEHLKIPVSEKLNQPVPLDGSGSTLTIVEYYERAAAEDRVEEDGPEFNPAVRFALYSPSEKGSRWEEWLFYRLPQRRQVDFGGVAGIELRLAETQEERSAWLEPEAFLKRYPKGQLRLAFPGGQRASFSVDELAKAGDPVPIPGIDLRLELEDFYPHAVVNSQKQELENASDEMANPALLFRLHGPRGEEVHSVFAHFPTFDRVQRVEKGVPYVESAQLLVPVADGGGRLGHLVLISGPGEQLAYSGFSKKAGRVRGPMEIGKPVKTNWMDMELVVERYLPKAMNRVRLVEAGAPADGVEPGPGEGADDAESPHGHGPHGPGGAAAYPSAVRVRVEGVAGNREYVAFSSDSARSKDTFPAGSSASTGITFLEYRVEQRPESETGNSLTLVLSPDRSLHYVVRSRRHPVQSGPVELRRQVVLPWMPGAGFTVEEYIERGRVRQEVVEASDFGGGEHSMPAVHVRARKGGEEAEGWVWWGVRHGTALQLGGETVHVSLFADTRELDFDVKLFDFRDVPNPGGEGIASFESDVDFTDRKAGLIQQVMINMNHPHEFQNLLFYQSSYVKQPGQPEVSVFTVSYDPGLKVVYAGFSLVVCGIVTMFYIKPWQAPTGKKKVKSRK
ncbi:MAG: cytochrome c biogenesis protein ResB [Planctomycetes bacterium]|nr:cytochrome c biogenesis protein ResB [Planctomycetota bacterium]